MNAENSQLAERIIAGYGLTNARILPPQKGYRNQSFPVVLQSGETVNLMLHKREPGALATIKRAQAISSYAAQAGFPCRIMRAAIAKLHNDTTTRYAALYNYLPGRTIPWEAYTMRHLKLLGKTLSDMHAALARCPARLPDIIVLNTALNERMVRYMSDRQIEDALKDKLGLVVRRSDFRRLFAVMDALPKQPLHMDFVRSNILFEGAGEQLIISGILDFEKTAHGPILFDIARSLAFLLVDCKHKDTEKVRQYFLHSGYQRRGAYKLAYTPTVKRALNKLITFNLLHDFYKFLRHNPYEYLPQNEHFVRTRDLLLARGIIEYT